MKSVQLRLAIATLPLALAACVATAPDRSESGATKPNEVAPRKTEAAQAETAQQLAAWHFDARPAAARDGYRPPLKLAVLLPLSGPLSAAASPVRDGLLAGYYGETRARPPLDFIDTAGPGGIAAACTAATAAGADFIIGPLGREQVDTLFTTPECSLPALALNRGDQPVPAGHASFSLAPEDDGIAAADYLSNLEKRNALVIASSDDNALRAAQAFRNRFAADGGAVVQTLGVVDNPGDMNAALGAFADKHVDAIFLAVRGNTARLLIPQLAIAGLGGATRVATSQLLANTGKPGDDAALDGTVFPTDAWTSRGTPGLPPASLLDDTLPTARGGAARLFAFGFDAWQLSAYLDKLLQTPGASIAGATGTLGLDASGSVQRTPAWSMFSGGVPTAIGDGH